MLVSRAPLQHDIGYVLDLAVLCTKMALCGEEHLTEFRIRPVYPNNIFSPSQMLFVSNFKVAGGRIMLTCPGLCKYLVSTSHLIRSDGYIQVGLKTGGRCAGEAMLRVYGKDGSRSGDSSCNCALSLTSNLEAQDVRCELLKIGALAQWAMPRFLAGVHPPNIFRNDASPSPLHASHTAIKHAAAHTAIRLPTGFTRYGESIKMDAPVLIIPKMRSPLHLLRYRDEPSHPPRSLRKRRIAMRLLWIDEDEKTRISKHK